MKAPFPWFGGKSRAARLIWERLGDVANYVEPFFGSGAALLQRPHPATFETVNDLDCYVANFWRAIQVDPYEVANWADGPVNEADLHARHFWLVRRAEFRERMLREPDYFDVRIAGWWVWGLCQWIGGAWCSPDYARRPHPPRRMPRPFSPEVWRGGNDDLVKFYTQIADRMRHVRVLCGDWSRAVGPSQTTALGVTGVLLDPPYSKRRQTDPVYGEDDLDVASQAREWAIGHGHDRLLRIALCGYEGEHEMPDDWQAVRWEHTCGYAARGERAGDGADRQEVIWFSPHCLPAHQPGLGI